MTKSSGLLGFSISSGLIAFILGIIAYSVGGHIPNIELPQISSMKVSFVNTFTLGAALSIIFGIIYIFFISPIVVSTAMGKMFPISSVKKFAIGFSIFYALILTLIGYLTIYLTVSQGDQYFVNWSFK